MDIFSFSLRIRPAREDAEQNIVQRGLPFFTNSFSIGKSINHKFLLIALLKTIFYFVFLRIVAST